MIKIIRLVTGEVVVGESVLIEGGISITRPALVHLQMHGDSQLGAALIPYHPWIEGPVTFLDSVLLGPPNDPDDGLKQGYNQRFNPDAIIVPSSPKSLIIE